MMKAYGVQFILKFIATGNAYKHSDDGHPPGPELVKTLREDPFVRLILKKNEEADTYAEGPVDCSTGEELETNRLPRSGEQRVLQNEELQLLVTAYGTVHPELVLPVTLAGVPNRCTVYSWVDLAGRPEWHRRITSGCVYEVLHGLRAYYGYSVYCSY